MAIVVKAYKELERWVGDFADNLESGDSFHVLVIIGDPGLLKSTIVQQVVGAKARWLEGTLSAFDLYCEAYEHRDRLIVIDDVDGLYHDKAAVRLLKCLCQTRKVKTLGWHTAAPQLVQRGVPREYETGSRVCIITNEWKALNKNLGALEDRGIVVLFQPPAHEVHAQARCDDPEVYEFIGQHLDLIATPSLRQYAIAVTLKKKDRDWKQYLRETWGMDEKLIALLKILDDPTVQNRGEVEREWTRQIGSSKPTYYRYVQKLPASLLEKINGKPKKPKAERKPSSQAKPKTKPKTQADSNTTGEKPGVAKVYVPRRA